MYTPTDLHKRTTFYPRSVLVLHVVVTVNRDFCAIHCSIFGLCSGVLREVGTERLFTV